MVLKYAFQATSSKVPGQSAVLIWHYETNNGTDGSPLMGADVDVLFFLLATFFAYDTRAYDDF